MERNGSKRAAVPSPKDSDWKRLLPTSTFAEFARILRAGGRFVFSVTHPDMTWDGYEMRDRPEFLLPDHADIFHHRFSDYLAAIDSAPFAINEIKQLAVSEKIRTLLTEESYEVVKGRFQIVVFRLRKQ